MSESSRRSVRRQPPKRKRLEDELAEEKCKVVEATAQFNTKATGRSIFYVNDPFEEKVTNCVLTVVSCRLP
jgi:hypothetical protein